MSEGLSYHAVRGTHDKELLAASRRLERFAADSQQKYLKTRVLQHQGAKFYQQPHELGRRPELQKEMQAG